VNPSLAENPLLRITDFTTSGVGIGKPFGVTKDLLVERQ